MLRAYLLVLPTIRSPRTRSLQVRRRMMERCFRSGSNGRTAAENETIAGTGQATATLRARRLGLGNTRHITGSGRQKVGLARSSSSARLQLGGRRRHRQHWLCLLGLVLCFRARGSHSSNGSGSASAVPHYKRHTHAHTQDVVTYTFANRKIYHCRPARRTCRTCVASTHS